jgi:predicted nucleic acid-binding Zn ribbon protein
MTRCFEAIPIAARSVSKGTKKQLRKEKQRGRAAMKIWESKAPAEPQAIEKSR